MPRKTVRHRDLGKLATEVQRVCAAEFKKTFGVAWEADWAIHLRKHRDRLIAEDKSARVRRSRHAAEAVLNKHGLHPDKCDFFDLLGHSPRIVTLSLGLRGPRPPSGMGKDLPRFTDTRSFVVNNFELLRVWVGNRQWRIDGGRGDPEYDRYVARRATNRQLAVLELLIGERGVLPIDANKTAAEVIARVANAIAEARKHEAIGMPERMFREFGATDALRSEETAFWDTPRPLKSK